METYLIITVVLFVLTIMWIHKKQLDTIKKENKKFIRDMERVRNTPVLREIPIIPKNIRIKRKKKPIEFIDVKRSYVINSGDRNTTIYPNIYNFVYRFGELVKNIKSIELVKFTMGKTMYTIDTDNDKMIILDKTNDTRHLISVPIGFYDINTYVSKLNELFVSDGIDLTISYYPLLYTTKITNNSDTITYEIIYESDLYEQTNFNCIGFDAKNVTIQPLESETSPRRVDLFGAKNISLNLGEVSYGYGDSTLANILITDAITVYDNQGVYTPRIISPLMNTDRLTIKTTFKQPFKERHFYNFNGFNYTAIIEITTVERKMPFEQIITGYS